jgi:hypothetical protein
MADSVLVLVDRGEGPPPRSQAASASGRLGNTGPTNLQDLPANIVVKDITGMISREEYSTSGYDYFLRNMELRHTILYGQLTGEAGSE